ncbi:WD40 repeat domain-containing protein, partial [bacterium]|nr:WD40 repeat domain-containing protein [bacterium]
NAPEKRVVDWVPQALKPDAMLVSEMAHNLSLGMAFRRMPTLHHLTTVPDGMVEVEISPSGRFAILGCRKQGETPGQVTLWDLGGNPEILVRPDEDVSIEQVAFARSTGESGESGDTWVAAGGSVGSDEKGVVFVWDLRDPGRSRVRIDTAVRVRDLAFGPASADGTRQWLAVATGEEMSLPARGQAEVYEITGAPGTFTVGQPRKLVPHPAADTGKSAPAADGRKSAISDLPATRLAFSQLGRLAVSYLDPVAGSSHLAVFEMHGDETWSGAAIFEDRLMFTDLAFSQDPHENLALATAKAGHGDGSVRVFHPGQSGWREPNPPLSLRAGILRVAFNPLGGSLAAAAANGFLGVWSIDSTGLVKLKREIAGDGWPFSIAWSPDGRWLAVGNRDRHARVWDVTSGRLVLPPLYHGATVANIAFTPDGLRLLASTLQSARLWGTAPREFSLLPVRAVERAQFTLLSGDGRHVAVASRLSGQARDGVPITELAVWRDERLVPANRYPGLPPLVKISLSDDGMWVAALTEPQPREENPQEALVWNNTSGQRWTIPVHSGADFLALLPGPVPRLLVAGVTAPGATQSSAGRSQVGFLQLFDLTLKIPVAEVVALDFRVKAFAATADGKRVVIGGDGGASPRGGFIATLDPAGGVSPANTLNRHAEAVTALALSKDGRLLLSGSIDDSVKLLAIAEDGRIQVLHEQKSSDERKHTADVVSVNFSHDGTRAVSTGRDFAAILYDVTGGRLDPLVVMEQRGAISHQAFSEDDQWLATGGEDGVSVWYVGPKHSLWQGKRMAALFHRYPVMGVAFTSTGELRTLALERSPDSANSSQVEAYRWKVEPVKARFSETRNNAELLAGRKLAGVPPAPVNLRSDELEARWHHSTLQAGDHPDAAQELLNQALAAATAGSWRAAAMHLRALRTRDPEFFQASPDILMFAAEIFESARDPANVLATTELLLPRIASQPERRLYLEKRGIACLQLASIPQAPDRDNLLVQAEADFKTLASEESGKWWWSVREAEVHVLREDWQRALESLEQSKRQLAAASGTTGELGKDSASVSQTQRIASIYLMQAAQARRQSAAALASQAEQEWAALVGATLEQFRDAKPTAKASAAWPAVLGEAGAPEAIETACAFAEEGFRERPTYARANTHALALLRAGRLDAAEKRLDEAISLYERERQKSERWPSDRKLDREGRPADWIVRALLLAARGASDSDAARRSLMFEKARKDLQDAREALDQPAMENLTEWRATWNFLDLRVLVAEAERKLAQVSHSP